MQKSYFPYILGVGIMIFMIIACTQSAKAQTPFTPKELEDFSRNALDGDTPLSNRCHCIFDNDGDGKEDTSFNMKLVCQEAERRGLRPRIVNIHEAREVLSGSSSLHITQYGWRNLGDNAQE